MQSDASVVESWAAQDALVHRLPSAMRRAFLQCNQEILQKCKTSGTTATLAVICGWELIVAAVGDSLAYLDTGSQVWLHAFPMWASQIARDVDRFATNHADTPNDNNTPDR